MLLRFKIICVCFLTATCLLQGCGDEQAGMTPPTGTQEKTAEKSTPKATGVKAEGPAYVEMVTNRGRIVLELYPDKAPVSVANFLRYVNEGFYEETIFHRVIPKFIIQGGGYTTAMKRKETHEPIKNESRNGLKNTRGMVAMARKRASDSATSQFFINVVDNPNLDYAAPDRPGYAVFGKVVEGMDVVDKIENAPRGRNGRWMEMPTKPVLIKSAKVLTDR